MQLKLGVLCGGPKLSVFSWNWERMILGVAWKTASDVVRGELGLWTMSGRFKLAVLRWWGKLVKMDRNRLCYKIYNYRRNHLREKGCWCKIVRDLLIDLNIGDIWISEEIGDLSAWGENVKSRVSAWEARSWRREFWENQSLECIAC